MQKTNKRGKKLKRIFNFLLLPTGDWDAQCNQWLNMHQLMFPETMAEAHRKRNEPTIYLFALCEFRKMYYAVDQKKNESREQKDASWWMEEEAGGDRGRGGVMQRVNVVQTRK